MSRLSTAIGGGLTFATVLTLLPTPCLLVLGGAAGERWGRGGLPPPAGEPSGAR